MRLEPFFYLFLFLFLGLITFLARWLRGEIEKRGELEGESKTLELLQERTPSVLPAAEGHQARERQITKGSFLAPTGPKKKRSVVKIHPRNLREMRQGIVLMIVLGPCRAVEPPNESLRF